MKQKTFYFKSLLLLALMVLGVSNALGQTVSWVKTVASDLKTGDVIVIVDNESTKSYALYNGNGTSSAPTATAVTVNGDQTQITSEVSENIQWVVTKDGSNYKFGISGTSNYLYCTNTNNGVRIGTNDNNVYTISGNYLHNTATSRYLGVYNGQDWRCYTNTTGNIAATKTAFYKKTEAGGDDDLQNCPITLNKSELSLDIYTNATFTLIATSSSTGAITWESSDPSVATVVGGVVTAIKAGSATITASQAADENHKAGSATCELTVVNSAPYVQPTEVTINFSDDTFGTSYGGSASGITDSAPVSATVDNVEVIYAGSGNHYINASQIRFYPNNKLTFNAPSGYTITKIVFTPDGTWAATISTDKGTYTASTKTWNGNAESIVFSGSGSSRCDMSKAVITLALPSSIATPTFSVASGEYESAQSVEITCATDGAKVYYTIDGTDPDNNSTEYTGAIAIGTTTTLKAIAYKGEDASNIATATYTINLPLTTIAKVKELTNNSTCKVNLTDAQVVFVDGDHIYVRDASGALEFYKSDLTLVTGDIFDATIAATYTLYNGQPELTTFTTKNITKKGNSVVVAKEISTIEEANSNVCDLVKFANVQLSESGGKYYIGETGIQLYDKFNVSYTTETDADVDVTGVVILYQRNNTGDITTEVCPRFAEDIVYLDNSVAVGISSETGYATFCSVKALDFTAVDAIYAYIATVEGSAITFTRVTKIPANTGVLLRSTKGGAVAEVNVPFLTAGADDVKANKFVAATTEIPSLASEDGGNVNYILNNKNDVVGFYKANGQKVAAGKAYLQVSVSQAKDMTFIGFDETTGVELMGATESTAQMFNLAGQRVCNDYKGIVIVNGKKVIR